LADGGLRLRITAERPSYLIDLAEIRATTGDYLATRSRNSRQQIRRSMRLFEDAGPLRLAPAASLDEALATLADLKILHQRYWRAKGKPGAFASPFFERFHRALVTDAWPAGKIDLLRLTVGTRTIGCLYNFVHEGQAYAYQSGFDFGSDGRCKPGLVSHSLAAQRYLDAGLRRYLLLAGEGQYKVTLATHSEPLYWLQAYRSGVAEGLVRAVVKVGQLIGKVVASPMSGSSEGNQG
jgi:CelD/BcsL family acetyltransferase involved in cellulose biosynthesis